MTITKTKSVSGRPKTTWPSSRGFSKISVSRLCVSWTWICTKWKCWSTFSLGWWRRALTRFSTSPGTDFPRGMRSCCPSTARITTRTCRRMRFASRRFWVWSWRSSPRSLLSSWICVWSSRRGEFDWKKWRSLWLGDFRNIGKSELEHFETNRNLIRAYSTTSHKSAYEKRDESNSIYVSALRKYLGEKMPILAILNKVNAGKLTSQLKSSFHVRISFVEIAQLCPQQMPTVSFITAEDFLLDQEINGDC